MFTTQSLLDACVTARKMKLRPVAIQVALAVRRAERYDHFKGAKARRVYGAELIDRYAPID